MAALVVRGWKSSGKWRSALRTGIGVRPPIAQSEPFSMVVHSSWRRVSPAHTSTPERIRSMSSTPRVEPIRQGVHLPHDSAAQNSRAKRAIAAAS